MSREEILLALARLVPVDVGRGQAGDEARRELTRPVYHRDDPSPTQRLMDWAWDELTRGLSRLSDATPGGPAGVFVLALVVVAAAVAIRLRLGPTARSASVARTAMLEAVRSSREHRAAADVAAAEGRWADAVRERLRATVRGLEERTLLEPRAGRTADEAAAEAGAVLPEAAAALAEAARTFDDVWYGGRTADAGADARMREADETARRARFSAGVRR